VYNYQVDERVTNLLQNTNIFIIPCFNPDGYEAETYDNSQGVNLFTNYPDRTGTLPEIPMYERQLETRALNNLIQSQTFMLSATIHSGGFVVVYPYDSGETNQTQYSPTPDDPTFMELALTYSLNQKTMWNQSLYENGTVNGALLSPIYGSMQDWNYYKNGIFEITLLLSNEGNLYSENFTNFWNDNKDALISYMELSYTIGVKGIITDARSNMPIRALIYVTGTSLDVIPSFSGSKFGDYYRPLLPGFYEITASARGYIPVSKDITVLPNQVTEVDFSLYKLVGENDSLIVTYFLLLVVVACSFLIFGVELIYYRRSKKKLALIFQRYDQPINYEANLQLMF